MSTPEKQWPLGRQIINVRRMTKPELAEECWEDSSHHGTPYALVLDDGSIIYPSTDEEGNGPGAMFIRWEDGTHGALT